MIYFGMPKGDLAVGVGINKSIKFLKSGTTGQIFYLLIQPRKLTGLAWVDENTIATDPIWDTGAKGSLAVKYSYLPEGAEKTCNWSYTSSSWCK